MGPGYIKGLEAAEHDLKVYGLDYVCNFALASQNAEPLDHFAIGYRTRANMAVERRAS